MRKPIVAVIGRPNVGKSTLFNRIIRRRDAIVDDIAGVTRDRKYAEAEWAGLEFVLVDTGGYFPGIEDRIGQAVLKQVEISLAEADVVAFMVDGRAGLTPLDIEIGQILKRYRKPIILVVNKVDNETIDMELAEFYRLGLGKPQPVSAESGRQVGDFLDLVLAAMPKHFLLAADADESTDEEAVLQLAVVGKPNVGKSSYINALLGQDKQIVTEIPGTTRDAIDTRFSYKDRAIDLVDTAGLRRRSKVTDNIEFYSTMRTLEAIRRCDIAIILLDATEPISDQDMRIIQEVIRFKKGIILAVNKWDLIEKDADTAKHYESELREQLHSLKYVPIIFISALSRKRIFKVLDLALQIYEERNRKIPTSALNKFLQMILQKYPPPSMDQKEVKINYITQVKSQPPVFALFANHPTSIKANYRQYIENQFRDTFSFVGVPLTFVFRKK